MPAPIDPDNLPELLTAFADGELDAAQHAAVSAYLAEHPAAMAVVRTHRRLKEAAGRAYAAAPAVPEVLRRLIEAMATDLPASGEARSIDGHAPARSRSASGRWRVLAVAATFLIAGGLAGHFAFPPKPPVPTAAAMDAVPASVVVHASRVHVDCSRFAGAGHTGGYPKELAGLSGLVGADLKSDEAHPDLSPLGFRFVGAGPCAAPLAGTAHLLYRSTAPGGPRMLSVFVQANAGQFALESGKLYDVSGPRSAFPVYAWRTDRVIYFLIADDDRDAAKARSAIAPALRL